MNRSLGFTKLAILAIIPPISILKAGIYPHLSSHALQRSSPYPQLPTMDQTQDKPDWRILRDELIAQREAKIPAALRIPQSFLENLPKDVTKFPRECGLLSSQELELTETLDAVAARDLIAEGKLAAVDVVTAFAKRAAIVHQLVSVIVFIVIVYRH